MTEEDWLSAAHPDRMLAFLRKRESERKLRLFAAACCRGVWLAITAKHGRHAVEVAERFADGETDRTTLLEAHEALRWARLYSGDSAASAASAEALESTINDVADSASSISYRSLASLEYAAQASLLRDIFGNPFRPITLAPDHRTPTVVALARAAYAERQLPNGELAPVRLAVLVDALKEAGGPCELVEHLRSAGPHIRGCFAVDLCLGLS